jgi:hypothetical protein
LAEILVKEKILAIHFLIVQFISTYGGTSFTTKFCQFISVALRCGCANGFKRLGLNMLCGENLLSLSLSLYIDGQSKHAGVLYKSGMQPVKCLPFHGCGTINKTGVKDKKFRSICQVKNENFYFTFSKQLI